MPIYIVIYVSTLLIAQFPNGLEVYAYQRTLARY